MDRDPLPACNFDVRLGEVSIGLSDVSGLEYDVETGQVGPVVLRRGAGTEQSLWEWASDPAPRTVTITLLDVRHRPACRYVLEGARPLRWIGPSLSATSGEVAAEQLVLVADSMRVRSTG